MYRSIWGMAEIAGVDIAGVNNDGVSRRGRHIDEGVRQFHKVKLSSRVSRTNCSLQPADDSDSSDDADDATQLTTATP